MLEKDENRLIRKSTGQLSWLASQTRPDLAFDALNLSVCLNSATFKDAKYSKKVVQKAKEEKYSIKFSHLGNYEDLHFQVFPDASLGNVECHSETKSVMGSFVCLGNKNLEICPLSWKSKIIDKVAEDIKSAETLALETSVDDTVYLASMLSEIYKGHTNNKLPIIIKEDSKGLVESLYSTKKVKRKTMRVVISSIQQYMKNGTIKDVHHVSSKDQLGDVFTKKGVSSNNIIRTVSQGILDPL